MLVAPPDETVSVLFPEAHLRAMVVAAVRRAIGDPSFSGDVALHRSAHADFQADVALSLARARKRSPRELAVEIAAQLTMGDGLARADVSGPGFINLTLDSDFLGHALGRMLADPRRGVGVAAVPEVVVVDYSGPNVAKEMHVGHLRSTIIGDAIARVLSWQGHNVIRRNHIGDWGTPFGMLIEHLLDTSSVGTEAGMKELVTFYQQARAKFDSDPSFAERARQRVVKLQSGDPETLAFWRRMVDLSVDHMTETYRRLHVTLNRDDVVGESHYNSDLPGVVAELQAKGIARDSEGAVCVFPPGFTGREGEPVPLIIRKQDGGFGYACTDLAALRQRLTQLGARRLVYVVGSPQSQHFAMVFATAVLAGWVDAGVRLEHVAFGSVLGTDKKMLKTRAGDTVSLTALIDEAVERAGAAVRSKGNDLAAETQARIAEAVGIGAVKYADLANDRQKDYVFDWNRMLSFEGNTAPYLMYAHARICSILRKGEGTDGSVGDAASGASESSSSLSSSAAPLVVAAPEERALALQLLDFSGAVARVGETLQPHRLCGYLYDLASVFTRFYEACPVLKASVDDRRSRLQLCRLTALVLEQGLDLLGISAPTQM